MKNYKLNEFALWSAHFSMQYPLFAQQANKFLGVNPDLRSCGVQYDNGFTSSDVDGERVAMCSVDHEEGKCIYHAYDKKNSACISTMITCLPFVYVNHDDDCQAFHQFYKDYHVYELPRTWLEDCRNMNYFTVYHHWEEFFEAFQSLRNSGDKTLDLYADEINKYWLFMNDFDCAFNDAVEGQFSNEAYTAIHFAELVRIAIRETLIQLFHKGIFIFVDWDNIYITGSHLNNVHVFLITFIMVLRACSKATMKLSLSEEEYAKHYDNRK